MADESLTALNIFEKYRQITVSAVISSTERKSTLFKQIFVSKNKAHCAEKCLKSVKETCAINSQRFLSRTNGGRHQRKRVNRRDFQLLQCRRRCPIRRRDGAT